MRVPRPTSLLRLLVALALAPSAGEAQAEMDRRPGVAVFPFTNGGSYGSDAEDLDALEVGLQQILLTELSQNKSMRIVERSVLRNLMEEQDLGASGRVDATTAADIGELVGARYAITGVFIDLDGEFHLDTRIVDVETGEIINTQRVQDERENLYGMVLETSRQITDGADLPALPAAVRQRRQERRIPAEAITLYSRAQVFQDAGRTDQAAEVYRRIVTDFPEMTEAREALEQISNDD